jgi:NAD-dependent deacetylase
MDELIELSARLIKNSKYTVAFTGAGMSVESGIPPFRGEDGLWSKYDPAVLDIEYFHSNTLESWKVIREIFYDFFGKARPNKGHQVLAQWESKGIIKAVITQNIDNLHQEAGSRNVFEFHGTASNMVCVRCNKKTASDKVNLLNLPPRCHICNGILKPDFIFFGEGIPYDAKENSFRAANKSEVFIVIGTTGEVMPASMLPYTAREKGAKIIEINPEPSLYTNKISDVHLQGKAGEILIKINEWLEKMP